MTLHSTKNNIIYNILRNNLSSCLLGQNIGSHDRRHRAACKSPLVNCYPWGNYGKISFHWTQLLPNKPMYM